MKHETKLDRKTPNLSAATLRSRHAGTDSMQCFSLSREMIPDSTHQEKFFFVYFECIVVPFWIFGYFAFCRAGLSLLEVRVEERKVILLQILKPAWIQ